MKMFYLAIGGVLVFLVACSHKNEANKDTSTEALVAEATLLMAERQKVAAEIEAVAMENLRAHEAEDLSALLDTLHTQSPSYSPTKDLSIVMFANYDLKFQSMLFRYVGQDDEYAIARWKFSTRKVAGPAFEDNDMDTFHVFRKENGKWKIWSHALIDTNFIN